MLTFLEYRVLKAFSKFPRTYLIPPEIQSNLDRVRFVSRKYEIHKKTIIRFEFIETITDELLKTKFLHLSADISELGLYSLHNYPKEVLKSIFTIYLPIVISIFALIISIIALIQS